jgi:hypothetical protein
MRAVYCLIVCCFGLLLSSCGQRPRNPIVGRWRSVEKPLIHFTFRPDGTFKYQAVTKENGKNDKFDKEYEGKYKVLSGGRLELVTYPAGQPSTAVYKIAFGPGGNLSITNGEEETTRFEKIENE